MGTSRLVNPFTQSGQWYRANLHTHTTNSDGQWTPRQVADYYRSHGYQVLALTDHNCTNDVAALSTRGFLVVNGAEYSVASRPGREPFHLVALNIPRSFSPGSAARTPAGLIRAVRAAGGEVILAHPFWSRHHIGDYGRLRGYAAIEIHNFGCTEIGRQDSEAHWSQLLDEGRVVPAVATDDGHGYPSQACGGWVWLKLPALNVEGVMEAIRTGCYYSSTGPRITEFTVTQGVISLRCSPARAVYIIAHGVLGGMAFQAERRPLRSIRAHVPPHWEVFRAVVEDALGRRAWTNPIVLRGGASRRQLLTEINRSWRTPHSLSAGVPKQNWKVLDLSPFANRSLTGKDAWIGDGSQLTGLSPGLHRIHGVPLRVLDQRSNRGVAAIALRSQKLRLSCGRLLPLRVCIPVGCTCRAVYFLHGAGFVTTHGKLADYVFEYEDGSKVVWPVLGYGLPLSGQRSRHHQLHRSSVQDWWPAFEQFENKHALKVILANRSRPYDYRVLYTLEWRNPCPAKKLRRICLHAAAESSAVLLVLAATVLTS